VDGKKLDGVQVHLWSNGSIAMRATIRRYSRSWRVHAIIVAIAILIGLIVAFFARPTRGLHPRIGTSTSTSQFLV
jgi:hypothetical protein